MFLVSAGESYRFSAEDGIQVRPGHQPDFARLIEDLRIEGERPLGVVHLWSLDACGADETTTATLQRDAEMGCGSVLHLVRTLADQAGIESSPLAGHSWGAVDRVGIGVPDLQSSPPSGVSVESSHWSIRSSRPGWSICPSAAPAAEMAGTLRAEISSGSVEDQVAYRAGERSVARLVRTARHRSRASLQVRRRGVLPDHGWIGRLGSARCPLVGRAGGQASGPYRSAGIARRRREREALISTLMRPVDWPESARWRSRGQRSGGLGRCRE